MNGIYFEDVSVGQDIPNLLKGPMSTAHLVRWCAAMENWHLIHFDWKYATGHDKLPDVMVNGTWKQNVMIQLLTDWVGESGWLWKINFQFRGMNVPGDLLTAWGRVGAVEITRRLWRGPARHRTAQPEGRRRHTRQRDGGAAAPRRTGGPISVRPRLPGTGGVMTSHIAHSPDPIAFHRDR